MGKNGLFIGGYFRKADEPQILRDSKGIVHYAANNFQINLLNGLEFHFKGKGEKLLDMSAPFIGSFPKGYTKVYFKTLSSTTDNIVDFINIFGIKNIFRQISLKRKSSKMLKNRKVDTVFVYSPHNPFLNTAISLKKKDKCNEICLIVPDLPQFMDLSNKQSYIYKILKSIDQKIFFKNLKYVDNFVLLTEDMKNELEVGERPYCIVEGIVPSLEWTENEDRKEIFDELAGRDYILYTGTLHEKFGVVDLLDAFEAVTQENTYLVIAGSGDSVDEIKNRACKNKKIIYLGQINNKQAKNLQKEAQFLINPRNRDEEFTKYSFPSKNMEYLLSGRPVLCYRLPGIPEEYDEYFYYIENKNDFSIMLERLLNLSKESMFERGLAGRNFVLENKNEFIQTQKILNMIMEKSDV